GQITVNGAPIDELAYLNLPDGDTAASNEAFDITVPEGSLWLLGDNRDRSRDSRAHQDLPSGGFVPLVNVVGKAFLTTWPLDRLGTIDAHHDSFNGVPDPE
ncbi:signal peptidase I, partial [Pseudomonas sp. BGM005]|nr:signal peptidase I [Pseudomonas sp. BG5]